MVKKVFFASDHAGFEAKGFLMAHAQAMQLEIVDCGCDSIEACDYSDFAHTMAVAMRKEAGAVGVLICGSGMGMSMAINRHFGMRGALCRNALDASFSRMHNDANVLVLGARFSPFDEVQEMFEIFLSTEFQGGRHRRRIEKIEVLI